jgi:hypothetical protein
MTIIKSIVVLALVTASANASSPQLPAGWRLPNASELSAPGDNWRDRNPSKYQSVRGDFDGDGKQDEAALLVSSDSKYFAVFFHGAGGSWKLLDRSPVVYLQSMGLSAVDPGKYPTACGKGYWACKKGEPNELKLSHEAILFFKDESAASAFVWSSTSKKFEQVWLSD